MSTVRNDPVVRAVWAANVKSLCVELMLEVKGENTGILE
jgi:hypothetical protein